MTGLMPGTPCKNESGAKVVTLILSAMDGVVENERGVKKYGAHHTLQMKSNLIVDRQLRSRSA